MITNFEKTLAAAVLAGFVAVSAAHAQGARAADKPVPIASAADAKTIAAEAYLQTFPLLQSARELDRQMNSTDAPDYLGKFNAFRHQDGLPSPSDASVRRKSYDAPYAWAWLDLRAEPVVLQVPAIPAGRFVVVQLYDLWGNNLVHVDAKTGGGRAVNVLVAGPGWKGAKPKGIERVVNAETSLVGVTGRIAAAVPGDAASVSALAQQLQIVPLSRFAKTAARKPAPSISLPRWNDAKAGSGAFIGYINPLLPFVRLDAAEQVAFKRYAGIGMVAGKPGILRRWTAASSRRSMRA